MDNSGTGAVRARRRLVMISRSFSIGSLRPRKKRFPRGDKSLTEMELVSTGQLLPSPCWPICSRHPVGAPIDSGLLILVEA